MAQSQYQEQQRIQREELIRRQDLNGRDQFDPGTNPYLRERNYI